MSDQEGEADRLAAAPVLSYRPARPRRKPRRPVTEVPGSFLNWAVSAGVATQVALAVGSPGWWDSHAALCNMLAAPFAAGFLGQAALLLCQFCVNVLSGGRMVRRAGHGYAIAGATHGALSSFGPHLLALLYGGRPMSTDSVVVIWLIPVLVVPLVGPFRLLEKPT